MEKENRELVKDKVTINRNGFLTLEFVFLYKLNKEKQTNYAI